MEEEKGKNAWSWIFDILEGGELLIDILVCGFKGLFRLILLLCDFLGDLG